MLKPDTTKIDVGDFTSVIEVKVTSYMLRSKVIAVDE